VPPTCGAIATGGMVRQDGRRGHQGLAEGLEDNSVAVQRSHAICMRHRFRPGPRGVPGVTTHRGANGVSLPRKGIMVLGFVPTYELFVVTSLLVATGTLIPRLRSPIHLRWTWCARSGLRLPWLVLILAVLWVPPVSGQDTQPSALVIHGGTIIDGTGRAPWSGVVVVQGDRLACVGTETDCPPPQDAQVLDATGRFLLPGFIDTHVHLHWTTMSSGTRQVQRLRFAYGITLVREAGTHGQQLSNLEQRAGQAHPREPVPRLLVSGLLEPGDSSALKFESPSVQVRRLATLGFDAIKVKARLPPEQLTAAAEVARGLGLPVYGHVSTGGQPAGHAPDAPEAFDGISHLHSIAPAAVLHPERLGPQPDPSADIETQRIWYETLWLEADSTALQDRIAGLVARGTWLEPLLLAEERFVHSRAVSDYDADFASFAPVHQRLREIRVPSRSPETQAQLEEVLSRIRAFVLAFHRAGGMIVAGTDNAPVPGTSFHDELEALVASGLSPAEALWAGTRNAALALGVGEQLGTIETGKLADLAILDANPLLHIEDSRQVWKVVKGGVLHDPSTLLTALRKEGRPASIWVRLREFVGTPRRLAAIFMGLGFSFIAGMWVGRLGRRSGP